MGPKGQERPVKYGIIGLDALKRDLLHWDSLYVSGRLQKPVLPLLVFYRRCECSVHRSLS